MHTMKRAEVKKRVTVHLSLAIYRVFHEYANVKAWSDGKAGARIIEDWLNGRARSSLKGIKDNG